jgi:nucleoside phosphorylase
MTSTRKIILLIDNQGDFVSLFKRVLERQGLSEEFVCEAIIPSGAHLLDDCFEQISKFGPKQSDLAAVLIDIVLDESRKPTTDKQIDIIDRSGFKVAAETRKRLPEVPILGITQWTKVQSLLTDVTLDENFDGLILKGILTGHGFSKRKFLEYLEKARQKHASRAIENDAEREVLHEGKERAFLGIICALNTPELSSVRQLNWSWDKFQIAGDDTVYYKGGITKRGQPRSVIAAATARMGLTAASILAMKMMSNFRPEFLAIVGITAGIPGKVKFGDVIAADPSWSYDNGKWIIDNGEPAFMAAPHQLPLDPSVRSKLIQMSEDHLTLSQIKHAWQGDSPDHELSLVVGPLASGSSVLSDDVTKDRVIKQHRELLGIEMETYSVFAAAEQAPYPRPIAFSLKSVVDFADGNKDDRYQKYAAHTSAQALRHFVENLL